MNLITKRLQLREWRDADREPFAEISADPAVMEFLIPLQREKALGEWIDNQINHMQAHGFCFWAVERKEDGIFIGTVGLRKVGYEAFFTPAVEIGWRIARPFWGLGYAPEAAQACLQFGFDTLNLSEIIAITVPSNLKSRRVMSKLGMAYNPNEDFDHPLVPKGHYLRRHVLYRLLRDQWQNNN
ncbi:MAG: GNAT family N-acetyltransferase [Zymomonas mobilis]|uniref:Ribosomal-protein-alanine N-acetyltransferase n=1 Tax=Zymomonas mobilis TaxID=542 RepID=A0A542W2Z0_ZYMMB|nr:GNAT family N-acetyltransferase [Zymomonas mobilis]TQL17859.1 ribosomal-protein-alanine N-acetyltransferase [Zymomonas mobilis]